MNKKVDTHDIFFKYIFLLLLLLFFQKIHLQKLYCKWWMRSRNHSYLQKCSPVVCYLEYPDTMHGTTLTRYLVQPKTKLSWNNTGYCCTARLPTPLSTVYQTGGGCLDTCVRLHTVNQHLWFKSDRIATGMKSYLPQFLYDVTGVTKAVVCVILSVGWCI